MKKQLLLFVMILLPMVVCAHDIAVQNGDGVTIYYKYINDGTELAVTYRGTSYSSYSNEYTGNVVIPDEVTYMNRIRKVTSIVESAFRECSGLTSVTIPNSVTSIGGYAFAECSGHTSGLTSVTIPHSVTSIEHYAFENCSKLRKVIVSDIAAWCSIKFGIYANPLYYAHHLYSDENTEIKDLVIPNSVTSIGERAFDCCDGLTSVTIPNSVMTIGSHAFFRCLGLTSITIGSGVTSIGDWAFSDCSKLTSVAIPISVTSIDDGAFCNCSGLTSVTIGSGVTSIGEAAFSGADIPTVITLIENPFTILGKTSGYSTFNLNTFNNATLYVPQGTIDKYKATDGWKDFVFIEESGTTPTPQKCEKPTISYVNGKLTFTSSTEGATCYYSITDTDIKAGSGNEVQLAVTYNISVYAAKSGCENSETANATLCWIDQQPKAEGDIDGIAQVAARAVLMKTSNGFLTVEGLDDETQVQVYTIDGKQAGCATSHNGVATIATSINSGSIAIVKVGEKSMKVVMK